MNSGERFLSFVDSADGSPAEVNSGKRFQSLVDSAGDSPASDETRQRDGNETRDERENTERNGFDIVIGNPQYGAKISNDGKSVYRKIYPETQFKIDTYSLFVLNAMRLVHSNGICYYIIPNTLLDNYYEEDVRKKLTCGSILEINDLSDKVFDAAVVHSMIFGFSACAKENHIVKVNTSPILENANINIPQSYFLEQPKVTFAIRTYGTNNLLLKLKEGSLKLLDVLDIRQAIKTGNDKQYVTTEKTSKNFKPILRGKDICKYATRDPHLYVNYGSHLACPRNHEIFEQPKILIREAGATITATLDVDNYYIMSSLYNAILIDKAYDLKYLIGVNKFSIISISNVQTHV